MKLLLPLCLIFLSIFKSGYGSPLKELPELASSFEEEGVIGTFVMLNPDNDTLYVHNANRASQRFIPASTFKIANTLIGLDSGVVSGVDEVLPYGGQPQPFKRWEKDMSLREAIKISNVPIYQELARRIGPQRMKKGLQKLRYGNMEMGAVIDQFWLKGPLAISAKEQVDFLRRLANGDLPLASSTIDAVREITLQESFKNIRLHGKTGWSGTKGWYVGWIERSGKIYPFALNIDMSDIKLAPKREALAKKCLQILGLYEPLSHKKTDA